MAHQEQYEKNPNGGYLNKSNYGNDSWYGKITLTPALLQHAMQNGAILVEVRDVQTTQYGECRRAVAKPFIPKVPPATQDQPQAQYQPQYQAQQQAPASGNYAPAPAAQPPVHQNAQPQPMQGQHPYAPGNHAEQPPINQAPVGDGFEDAIPF